jgi:hypothetical protein
VIAHVLRSRATKQQIEEMLLSGVQIKFVVDVESEVMVGGGVLHWEGEQMLLEQGSRQENLWAGSWYPKERMINFFSTVNQRPRQNRSQDILDPAIRTRVEKIIRRFLEGV